MFYGGSDKMTNQQLYGQLPPITNIIRRLQFWGMCGEEMSRHFTVCFYGNPNPHLEDDQQHHTLIKYVLMLT